MPPVDFQTFRDIAETRRDATISVNDNTGNVQVRDNNVFNRLITWIGNKFRPDPTRQQTQRESAYNSFLRAVGNEIRYGDQLHWVEAQLGADVILKKPLTSRRVRELFTEMDNRTTEAHRNSRVTAHYMAGRDGSNYLTRTIAEKIEERPVLQAAGFELGSEDRETVAGKIFEAVMEASADGRRDIGYAEGNEIAGRLIDEALDAHERRTVAVQVAERAPQADEPEFRRVRAQVAGVVAGAGTPGSNVDAASDVPTQEATGHTRELEPEFRREAAARSPGATQTPAAGVSGEKMPGAAGPVKRARKLHSETTGAPSQALLKDLKKLELPSDVKTEMKKLLKDGTVANFDSLVKHANKSTFDWIFKNRIGRWYYEGLKNSGAAVGKEVEVPWKLIDSIEEAISRHPYLLEYPEVKVNARKVVASYIASEQA